MDFKDSQRIYGVKFPQSAAGDIVWYCPRISTFQIAPIFIASRFAAAFLQMQHGV